MAARTLKLTKNYGNLYEGMRAELSKNSLFNEEDWINVARGNISSMDLDTYIMALVNSEQNIPDIDKFYSDYNYEFADSKTRLASLYNETYADKNNTDTLRKRYVTDENGNVIRNSQGNPLTESYKASDYEYYKSIIKEQNDIYYQDWLHQQNEERKKSEGTFAKIGYDILGVNSNVLTGIMSVVDGITAMAGGAVDAVTAMSKGKDVSDAFVKSVSSTENRYLQPIQDWLVDFESNYTRLRDSRGNYTNLGKYLGSAAYSIGQMIPSMLLSKGVGKGLTAAGESAKLASRGASASSQLMFYGGITSNNIRDIYTQFAAEGVTVSTEAVLANAAIKSTLEYAVEIGLGKLMGGTTLDNLVFGRGVGRSTGKSLALAGLKRILKDAHQEGLEEVLQDTSSFFVDRAFMVLIDENFGELTELTAQSIMDAYILGAVISIGGSAVSLVSTSRKEAKEAGFKGVGKKLAYYEYGVNLRSFVENYNTIMEYHKNNVDATGVSNDVTKDAKISSAALAEMYASYRIISSMYNEIGEERVKAADAILTKITNDIKAGKFDSTAVDNAAKHMYDSVFSEDKSMAAEDIRKIKEAGMTEVVDRVLSEEIDESDLDEDVKESIQKVIDASTETKEVIVTKDGNRPVQLKDKVLVPERLLKNADSSVVLYSIAEQSIVEDIEKSKYAKIKLSLDKVLDSFKKLSGREDAIMQDAIYSLMLDPDCRLYRAMLVTANSDMLNLLTGLLSIVDNFKIKNLQDAYYNKKIITISMKMKVALTQYAKVNPYFSESMYSHVLSNEQVNSIRKVRWSQNIYNRVVNGETLSDTDNKVLQNRINYSPLADEDKKTLSENLKSTRKQLRKGAMNRLDYAYQGLFTSDYDGKTYMPMTTIPNVVFNNYMQDIGKNLSTLLNTDLSEGDIQLIITTYGEVSEQTILQHRVVQFMKATNNMYSFSIDNNGSFSVIEVSTNKRVGYSKYKAYRMNGWDESDKVHFVTLSNGKTSRELLKSIVSKDLDAATFEMITITDVINNDGFLSKEVDEDIKKTYGYVTPETKYLYLHRSLIEKNAHGITVLNGNNYAFVDMTPMYQVLKKDAKIIDGAKISDVIKRQYLVGRLSDISIRVISSEEFDGKYDPFDNVIFVSENAVREGGTYLEYVFLHELQHAMQHETGMLRGFNTLSRFSSKEVIDSMLSDVKKHRPDLFKECKNRNEEMKVLDSYVYDTSGEFMAYGMYANTEYFDFYPTFIVGTPEGVIVTFPWGNSYNIGGIVKNGELLLPYVRNQSYEARLENKTKEVSYDYFEERINNKKDFRAFIKPNGKFAVIDDAYETHSGLIETIRDSGDHDYKTFFDSIPQVSIQYREGYIYAAVRVSGTLTKDSNDMLLSVMDKLYSKNINFEIGDVEYEFYSPDEDYDTLVSSSEAANSDELLTLYNRTKSANKVNRTFPVLAKPKGIAKTVETETKPLVKKPKKQKKSAPERERTKEDAVIDKEVAKRYVTWKEALKSNLKYFVKKYKRLQMAPELQKFIVITTGKQLPEELQDKISGKHKGTLEVADVMDYLRMTDIKDFDQTTFEAINEAFFQNDTIKTPQELQHYIDLTAEFYAARVILRSQNPDLVSEDDAKLSLSLIKNMQSLKDSDKAKQLYNKVRDRFFYKTVKGNEVGDSLNINEKYLRWLWMSHFDGSLNSGARIANIARFAAKNNWNITGEVKTTDIEKSIGDNLTLGDTLEDKGAYQAMLDAVNDFGFSEKREKALLFAGKYIRNRFGSTDKAKNTFKDTMRKLSSLSDVELNKILVKTIISQITGIDIETLDNSKISEKIDVQVEQVERPGNAIVDNIKSIVNTQNKRLTFAQKKLFVKYNSDVFEISNQKIRIKQEVLDKYKSWQRGKRKYTDTKGLNELWDRVKVLSEQVRGGEYANDKAYKRAENYRQQMRELLNNQKRQKAETVTKTVTETIVKEKIVEVQVSDRVLELESDRPMPEALERILDFEFSKPVETRVKEFSDGTETHRKASYKEFLAQNAERLEALTQNEVNDIVDFYLNSQISKYNITEEVYRMYQVTEGWILAFLLKGNKLGWYSLSENQYDAIRKHLTLRASVAAQMLQAHSTAIDIANPEQIIVESLAKSTGIEFSPEDIKELTNAIHANNIERVTQVKQRMYSNAYQKYGKRDKKFTEKLIQFERIMMLSGPGTWVRNYTSNAIIGGIYIGDKQIVPGVLDTSEHLGKVTTKALAKLFPGKKWFNHREGQYKITGTKVTDDVKSFLDKNLISNGLLDETLDGLSKYNPRSTKDNKGLTATAKGADALAKTIASGIATKIFYANTTDIKVLDNIYNFVIKHLSDDKYVKRRVLSYLGKMLTEDGTRLDAGLTVDVTNTIAEAFILASQDFMHRSNIITKFEAELFRRAPKPVYFVYKQFFPFAATSWNWFLEGLNYTPAGLINSVIKLARLENTIDKLELQRANKYLTGDTVISSRLAEYTTMRNVGKGVIGTVGTLVGVLLAAFGVVQLDEEDDKYKLKCGNVYVDITDVFTTQGIFIGMSMTKSIMDAFDEDSDTNFVDVFANTLDAMFMDSTIADLYNTFRYSEGVGDLFLCLPEKTLNAFIPNFFKSLSSMANKYKIKYDAGILGKVEKMAVDTIPFLAYAFPKYIDPYTGENQVMYKAPFITNIVNKLTPLDISPYNVSETEKTAISVGVNKSMLTGSFEINDEKVKLSAKEIEELNKYYGQLNKNELAILMSNGKKYKVKNEDEKYEELYWKHMTDDEKAAAIKQIMSKNSGYAKVYILNSKGYTYYASSSEYAELRKLGIDGVYKKTPKKSGFYKS